MDKDHMKKIAERNADRSERDFRRYLAKMGWNNTEIEYMWDIAKKCGDVQKGGRIFW